MPNFYKKLVLQDMPYQFIKDQVGIQNTPTLYWCDNDIIFAWVLEKTRSNCTCWMSISYRSGSAVKSFLEFGSAERITRDLVLPPSRSRAIRLLTGIMLGWKKANKQKSQLEFDFFGSLLSFAFCSLNYLVFWHYKEVFLVALLKEDHDVG